MFALELNRNVCESDELFFKSDERVWEVRSLEFEQLFSTEVAAFCSCCCCAIPSFLLCQGPRSNAPYT